MIHFQLELNIGMDFQSNLSFSQTQYSCLPQLGQHDQSTINYCKFIIMRKIKIRSHSTEIIGKYHNKRLLSQFCDIRESVQFKNYQQICSRLPSRKMTQILTKVGANSDQVRLNQNISESSRNRYIQAKTLELRKKFNIRKKNIKSNNFECSLDEVVIDCYDPLKKKENSEIWQNYRQNLKQLRLRTSKILVNRLYCQ